MTYGLKTGRPGTTVTELGAMTADINMNTHQLTALSVPDAVGEAIRQTAKITEVLLESATDLKHAAGSDNQDLSGKVSHSLATAENDVLVGAPSPFGSWVKKTLAEFKTILGLVLTQTANTVGFTLAGGTTPKTLTVTGDATISATPLVSGGALGTPASGNLANCTGYPGGVVGNRVNKTQADSPYTVTTANLTGLIVFTNTGASGETIFQLPAGADGYKSRGIVTAAQYMQFLCNGSEKIRYLGTQTAAGGYVRSNVIGNMIEVEWSGTEWVVTGLGGPWTYDS